MTKLAAFLPWAMFFLILTSVNASAQLPVPLGAANSYAVLAGDTITNTGATTVNGDLGLFPGTSVVGAPVVTGAVNVNNGAALAAKNALNAAWVDAGGRGSPTILAAGALNGATLAPGVYKDDGAPASLALTGTLTLDFQGDPNAVFIFQSASTLQTFAGSNIFLINAGGGTGCNVVWSLGSAATIASTTFVGSILAHDDISVAAGVTVAGRLLAGAQGNGAGALTLNTNTITASLCAAPPPPPPPPLALTCPVNAGQLLIAYSSATVGSGGTPAYTFSVASGALPAGLTLNTSTGAITGTPTTPGPFNFTTRVTDSLLATTTSPACGITIFLVPPPPPPPPPSLPSLVCSVSTGQVGILYISALAVFGGTAPFTFSISSGSLPAGLSLNPSTGAITGTPTTTGQFSFNGTVTDSLGLGTTSPACGITVAASPAPSFTAPDLTITKSHSGNFQQGGAGSYTLTVQNIGTGSTSGAVTVSDILPAGLTATAISGSGWSCVLSGLSCTRSDVLAAGATYPPVMVTVNVANNLIGGNQGGNGLTFQPGDILLSMKDGTVQWRRHDWTLVKTLISNTDGQAKGMGFDAAGSLFVTHYYGTGFAGNDIAKFDPNGNFIGMFGSGYDCNPASVVFDNAGNAYVGHADCSGNILKFDTQGNLVARYDVAIENRGSSHILLDPNQCTMYYTSEGPNVKRYNVCTNSQMPDFNTTPLPDSGSGAQQFSLLPGGGLLVANFSVIARLDVSGNLVRTYDAPGDTHCWLGMSLDSDGTSFWASNWCGSSATRFDIATGNVIETHSASDIVFMIKQIMVVPPVFGATVLINTAKVSGGGDLNPGNNSASDPTTIIIVPTNPEPAATPAPAILKPIIRIFAEAHCAGATGTC